MDRFHPSLRRYSSWVPIYCDVLGRMVEILHGDNRLGMRREVVEVARIIEAPGNIYVEGLCLDDGEPRVIRFDLIHHVTDVETGKVFKSATSWLADYGVNIGLHRSGGRVRCRALASPGRRAPGAP